MTEHNGQSHSDPDSGSDDNKLAPEGHKLQKTKTALRFASSKLSLVNNPVQESHEDDEEESLIHHDHKKPETPGQPTEQSPLRFTKREAASTSELFYDLWFVANLNVFATVHPVTELNTLITFIGYFLLLWITWLITTVFDARFGQDGIFERLTRASHLTVMIGFAAAGVTFDQDDMIRPVFKATSLCLMASRLVLAAQYGLVLFHARHHRRGRKALMFAVGLHLLPAIGYLIAACVVSKYQSHHLPVIWYVLGLIEMASIIVHATFSKTLSFEGTHFNERLNLLTLIILGEGVIILAKNITKIVEYTYVKEVSEHWSSALVGILVSAGALLYIIFQLYFDWMHHHSHMNASHQALWTIIHLPFHIVLVLLAEGGSQWAVWWRAMEAFQEASTKMRANVFEAAESLSTSKVVDELMETVKDILKKYGSDVLKGGEDAARLAAAAAELREIPDSFWSQDWGSANPQFAKWSKNFLLVASTVMNAIADAFDLSVVDDKQPEGTDPGFPELQALSMTGRRLELIFTYMYISAGLVLILLMLMALVSKRRGWSVFNISRTAFVFTIGLGLCLVSLINTNHDKTDYFLTTPWPLPTIMLCFLAVLIITHLPHPPRISFKRAPYHDVELGTVPAERTDEEASQINQTTKVDQIAQVYQVHQVSQNEDLGYHSGYHHEMAQPPQRGIDTFAHLPGHYDVGRKDDYTTKKLNRGTTLRRGLTSIQRVAKSIQIEAGGYDPIAEGELFFRGGNSSTVRPNNLYSV